LFANHTPEDILLRKEIEELRGINPQSFKINFIVTKGNSNWNGMTGHLDKSSLQQYLPAPSSDTLIMYSGTKSLNKMIQKTLEELGYTEEMIVKF
jgi:cytochrome-b5 reductase